MYVELGCFLSNRNCKIYSALFDVRFPNRPDDTDAQTYTVVRPDICVVCDLAKLDEVGCKGAPDLIVEILFPSTVSKDLNEKYQLYEEHEGVLDGIFWRSGVRNL